MRNWPAGCETSILPDRDTQQGYWDANLDAANLGGSASITPESLLQELEFSNTPDIQEMVAHLAPAPGKTILEIGTGLGANAVLMARVGANVVALDISHERLLALRNRTGALRASGWGLILPLKAKAEALPFKSGLLDGACCRAVLIHTDLPIAVAEAARALKPGAPVAFSEPMAHNPFVNLYRATFAPKAWRGITTYFTDKHIESVSRPFIKTQTRRYYGFSFAAFAFQYAIASSKWFYLTLRPLRTLDNLLVKRWPRLGNYAWFVLITGYNNHK